MADTHERDGKTLARMGRRGLLAAAILPLLPIARPGLAGRAAPPGGATFTCTLPCHGQEDGVNALTVFGYGDAGAKAARALAASPRLAAPAARPGAAPAAAQPQGMCLLLCDAGDEKAFVTASRDADTRGEAEAVVLLVAGYLDEAGPFPRPRRHTRLFARRLDDAAGTLAEGAEDLAAAIILSGAGGVGNAQALRALWAGGRSRGAEGVLRTVRFMAPCDEDDNPLPSGAADPAIKPFAMNTLALLELARGDLPGPKLPCLLNADAVVLAHLVLPPQDLAAPVAALRSGLQTAIQDAPQAYYLTSENCEGWVETLQLTVMDPLGGACAADGCNGDMDAPTLPAASPPTWEAYTITEWVPVFPNGGPVPSWPVAVTCEVEAAMAENCRVTWALVVQEPDTLPPGGQRQAQLGAMDERGDGRNG